MKKLTCEMCGSTDLLKSDGVFVCQSCSTKYSVEEAKKMMIEGTVEVTGTVKVDNTEQIKSFLEMAINAYDGENFKESENYANKIIEINPTNAEAWWIKGKSAGWQSTIGNLRFNESLECWLNTLKYVEHLQREEYATKIEIEMKTLTKALISLKAQNFGKSPSDGNKKTLCDAESILRPLINLIDKANLDVEADEITEYMAFQMNIAAVSGYNFAVESQGKELASANEYSQKTFIERLDNCVTVLEIAAVLAKNESTLEQIYKNLLQLQESIITSNCYKRLNNGTYYKYTVLTSSEKDSRSRKLDAYEIKKKKQLEAIQENNEEKEKKRKQKIAKYWEEHTEEKARIDSEKADIEKRMKELDEKISEIEKKNEPRKDELRKERSKKLPAEMEWDKQRDLILDLSKKKENLGLFKIKEKNSLQQRIDQEDIMLKEMEKSVKKEKDEHQAKVDIQIDEVQSEAKALHLQIRELFKRNSELEFELTKDR